MQQASGCPLVNRSVLSRADGVNWRNPSRRAARRERQAVVMSQGARIFRQQTMQGVIKPDNVRRVSACAASVSAFQRDRRAPCRGEPAGRSAASPRLCSSPTYPICPALSCANSDSAARPVRVPTSAGCTGRCKRCVKLLANCRQFLNIRGAGRMVKGRAFRRPLRSFSNDSSLRAPRRICDNVKSCPLKCGCSSSRFHQRRPDNLQQRASVAAVSPEMLTSVPPRPASGWIASEFIRGEDRRQRCDPASVLAGDAEGNRLPVLRRSSGEMAQQGQRSCKRATTPVAVPGSDDR